MVELHAHSLLSDGELLLSEIVRRYQAVGYRGVALTDHADLSNCEFIIESLLRATEELSKATGMKLVAGAELTHVPPSLIEPLVRRCRRAGAKVVLVHGETIVEPVAPGTNRAGIEAGADIIAHPGLISGEDVRLAAARGVRLEISGRGGHSLANGHVARVAQEYGAELTYGTDMHVPGDILAGDQVRRVLLAAGLSASAVERVLENNRALLGIGGGAT